MKSQSIAQLLNGSEYNYWVFNLEEDKVYSRLYGQKRPSKVQGQFYFSKSDGTHGLHPGSEGDQ